MLNFYSFNLKKNITITNYLQTDKLINHKSLFEKNMIDFDSSIFLNNFQKIDKYSFLKDLNDNIIIIDNITKQNPSDKESVDKESSKTVTVVPEPFK